MKTKIGKFLFPPIGQILWGVFMIIFNIAFIVFDLYYAVDHSLKGQLGSALFFGICTCFMIHYLRTWILRTVTMIRLRRLAREIISVLEKLPFKPVEDIPHEEVKE